jgi:hypothetical protein
MEVMFEIRCRGRYAIDRGRSDPLKAAEGGANNSSSGETASGTYDLGLFPACTLLPKAGEDGTNSESSVEMATGPGDVWTLSLSCSSLIEATGDSNGDSGGTVTDEANDGRGLSPECASFVRIAGGRANWGLRGEFADGTYDD